jgi:DnaJ family protein C protein 8
MDRPMESGTLVEIHGLKARPDLNGKRARVVTFASDRDRYQITVDGGEELYLKAVNLKVTDVGSTSGGAAAAKSAAPVPATVPTPGVSGTATLLPDTEVSISGLKARPDLNGLNGVVVAYVAERERYHVVVSDTEEETYLRRANLTAIGGSDETKPAEPETNPEPESDFDEDAAAKAAVARESIVAGAGAAASQPPPPIEELKDTETLLREFFADVSDATRDAEVERILGCFKLNPYEHLGLKFDAEEKDVKRAFRKVSLLVHPDKCQHANAKAAFDAIGQAQQLLGTPEVKKELDFNLERAKETVTKEWRKNTRNDVVLRVRFSGNREAQLAAFLASDEFHELWKLEARKIIVDIEWRRRKLTLRIKSEETRVEKEEAEEFAERKRKSKAAKEWDNENAREGRVGGWRDFTKAAQKGGKKQKVAGGYKGPKLKKEERSTEEEYHGLDRNGKRVARPDEVSKAF